MSTGILNVRASHGIRPIFDDPNLVSTGGLSTVLGLAARAGLGGLLDQAVSVPVPNALVKARTMIAGMLADADQIDDLDVLCSGGTHLMIREVRAPSTMGKFLRASHSRAVQLGTMPVLTGLVGWMISPTSPVLVDLDDTLREAHGYRKQGIAYEYSKAMASTRYSPRSPPRPVPH